MLAPMPNGPAGYRRIETSASPCKSKHQAMPRACYLPEITTRQEQPVANKKAPLPIMLAGAQESSGTEHRADQVQLRTLAGGGASSDRMRRLRDRRGSSVGRRVVSGFSYSGSGTLLPPAYTLWRPCSRYQSATVEFI